MHWALILLIVLASLLTLLFIVWAVTKYWTPFLTPSGTYKNEITFRDETAEEGYIREYIAKVSRVNQAKIDNQRRIKAAEKRKERLRKDRAWSEANQHIKYYAPIVPSSG